MGSTSRKNLDFEELYRILVENAMDALIICDQKLNLIYVSPSTERIFGYEQNELNGHNAFEFFHPEDIVAHKKRLEMLLQGKDFASVEFRIRKKNGNYVWCDVASKAVQDSRGNVRICVVARDISERKKTEEDLRISQNSFRQAQKVAHIGVWDWMVQPDILVWSEEIYKVFGFSLDMVPSVEKFLERVHPDDLEFVKHSIDGGLKGEPYDIDMRIIRTDGATVWANATGEVEYDKEGTPVRFFGMFQDITERKKTEAALRESEGRYRGLTEAMADTMLESDSSGKITFINHLMPGLSREQVLTSTVFDFVPKNQVPIVEKSIEGVFKRGEVSKYESLGPGPNGESRNYEVSVSPIYAGGKTISAVFLARDITERKKMQEELKKYSENLESLVAQRNLELNKTKDYLEQLISQLPLALVAWDKEFRIKTWNPEAAKMFGFSEQEFLEKSPENLFSQKGGLSPFNKIWNDLIKNEQAIFVGENTTKEGKTIICNWTNMLLRDENGSPNGVLSMIRDITEKRKLEERLKDIAYSLSGVKAGESYLVSSIHQSLKIAFDLNRDGVKGLFIVREDPDSLIKDYNFNPEDIVLLSKKSIKEFKAINDLQEIAIAVTKFLKNGGGVVVLSGLEYLISRNGFNPVFMMLQEKRFEFLEAGATLLVPVNLETLDSREKGLLGSELKLI
jgi:PAS domain S-box-containing protein